MKKTAKQLDREIAAALTAESPRRGRGMRHAGAVRSTRATHATNKSFDWTAFSDGAAFGFWASPYVSAVESLAEESRDAYRALAPGSGGNWEAVMPAVPPAARAVAKKFTKAARDKLTAAQLDEVMSKYSAYDAGYYGAMQSQGEGVGWYDQGVRVDPPRGFDWDVQVQNAVDRSISKGLREAGVSLPRR